MKTKPAWIFVKIENKRAMARAYNDETVATEAHDYYESFPFSYRVGPIVRVEVPLPERKARAKEEK